MIANLCIPCKDGSTLVVDDPAKKRQKLQHQPKNLKFTAEFLFLKRKDSQKVLTNFAFKPCCNKKCLIRQFGKTENTNFFHFDEAKKCVDYYYDIYKFKTKDEYNSWLYDKFISWRIRENYSSVSIILWDCPRS